MPVERGTAMDWIRRRTAGFDLQEHEDKILLLLVLVISAVVGLTIVGFVAATENMGRLLLSSGWVSRLGSPIAGSLVGGWLLYRFFPGARGSGIPQTRIALLLEKGIIPLSTVVGKFLCSSISLASGIALGREGPSVHIGAGIASTAGRRLGLSEDHVRSLIPVGTAAAVAAAFNTPLAAVLFTLEEILADLHARVVGSVVIGAATSWIILRLLLGDEPLFHVPAYRLVHPLEFFAYALLGVLGGLVSTGFVKLLLWQRKYFLRTPLRWKPFAPAAGGLAVGLMALAVPGVLGVGYNIVGEALNGQTALRSMLLLLVLKLVATSVCYASGNAGGIFGPSLFIGAMLGGAVGSVAHALFPAHTGNAGAYALVGMGAAFAGIIRTPMTSVIMIFEITRDYSIIVPLMIANLCSYSLAQRLQRTPIYEALARQDGVKLPSESHLPEPLTVAEALPPQPPPVNLAADPSVYPDDTLDVALQRMGARGLDGIAVVSRSDGPALGMLSLEDVLAAYRRTSRRPRTPARNWLPAVAAVTTTAILLIAGMVFWQRNRWTEQGTEAFERGKQLLAQGQTDEAVLAFRNALAFSPRDVQIRAALGLALVRSSHFTEAETFLKEVVTAGAANGPVYAGLGRVELSKGDRRQAIARFEQALNAAWPPDDKSLRQRHQLDYAELLAAEGRSSEAVSRLLTLIEQSGGNQALARLAVAQVATVGGAEKSEEAYAAMVRLFPADPEVWLRLADARAELSKDAAALAAYRQAAALSPANADTAAAVARMETILQLDPTLRGLSVRERARRWDAILSRTLQSLSTCAAPDALATAAGLLKQRSTRLEVIDQKMDAALTLWRGTDSTCRTDAVLAHIFRKMTE